MCAIFLEICYPCSRWTVACMTTVQSYFLLMYFQTKKYCFGSPGDFYRKKGISIHGVQLPHFLFPVAFQNTTLSHTVQRKEGASWRILGNNRGSRVGQNNWSKSDPLFNCRNLWHPRQNFISCLHNDIHTS